MNNKAGVWIDHRKATIVSVSLDGTRAVSAASNLEKHLSRSGDSPLKGSYEAQQVPADDSRQRAYTSGLNAYYDSVIEAMGNITTLIILGPGEAKTELRKRLLASKSAIQVVLIEPAEAMTDNQIAAKVRAYFGIGAARR